MRRVSGRQISYLWTTFPPLGDTVPEDEARDRSLDLTDTWLRYGGLRARPGTSAAATLAAGSAVYALAEFDPGESDSVRGIAVTDTGEVRQWTPSEASVTTLTPGLFAALPWQNRLLVADGASFKRLRVPSVGAALVAETAGPPPQPVGTPSAAEVTHLLTDGDTVAGWDQTHTPIVGNVYENPTPVGQSWFLATAQEGTFTVLKSFWRLLSGLTAPPDPAPSGLRPKGSYYYDLTFPAVDLRKARYLKPRYYLENPFIPVDLSGEWGHFSLLSGDTGEDPAFVTGSGFDTNDWTKPWNYGIDPGVSTSGDWLQPAEQYPVVWARDSAKLNGVTKLRVNIDGLVQFAHNNKTSFADPDQQYISLGIESVYVTTGVPTGDTKYAYRYVNNTLDLAGPLSASVTVTVSENAYSVDMTVPGVAGEATHVQLCRMEAEATRWSVVDEQANPGDGGTVTLSDTARAEDVTDTFLDERQGVAPSAVRDLTAWNGRIVAATTDRLYISTTGTEEFPATQLGLPELSISETESDRGWQYQVPSGAGRVMAVREFGGALLVFCDAGVWIGEGDGLSALTTATRSWSFHRLAPVTCLSGRSVAVGPGMLAWLASDGVYMLRPQEQPKRVEGINATLAAFPDLTSAQGFWHDGAYGLAAPDESGAWVTYLFDPRAASEKSRGWTGPWRMDARAFLQASLRGERGALYGGGASAAQVLTLFQSAPTDPGGSVSLLWSSGWLEGTGDRVQALEVALMGANSTGASVTVTATVTAREENGRLDTRPYTLTAQAGPWNARTRVVAVPATAVSLSLSAAPGVDGFTISSAQLQLAQAGRRV